MLREAVCGDQGQFNQSGWGLVSRKSHRAFPVGGTDEAGGGDVLQSSAEAEYQK